ncbi:MAG TPA: glycosyltransferase family 2 protein [Pyrinomonadaceae bacterium]|nr:glycosyltransferase family 2 protein [Pyrinomonadaceae bacterium]
MVRLSICIATYNRADVIAQTLESILPQLREGVELLVVDGASPDATESVVNSQFKGRIDCRYVRLPAKGGLDQDYCLAVEHAQGEYCWLMTDDDVLKPHAINRVMEALQANPDLLVVNAEVAGPDLKTILTARLLKIKGNREFGLSQGAELLALAGSLLSFIGAVVVRRDVWLTRDPKPYLGSEFVHVGMIFQAPLERGARLLAQPQVRIRYGRALWSPRAFEIWMFKWPQLVWGLPAISDEAKKAVCPRNPWKRTVALAVMKAMGCYTLAEYRQWLKPLKLGTFTRLRLAGIAAFPDSLFNALMQMLLPLVIPGAKGTLLNLRQSRFDYRRRWPVLRNRKPS